MKQPLVLICGVASDPSVEATVEAARDLSVRHVFLDQREFGNATIDFADTPQGVEGRLTYYNESYQLSSVTGVFSRLVDAAILPGFAECGCSDKRRLSRFHHQLSAWIDSSPARVVKPGEPSAGELAALVQPQVIRRFFRVPDSLLTNDGVEALRFIRKHGQVMVTADGVSMEVELNLPAGIDWMRSQLGRGAVLLQKRIEGLSLAVTTLGERCVIAGTLSGCGERGTDGDSDKPPCLPAEVEEGCLRLVQALELKWARVNLRLTDSGCYYCVGVDAHPALSYCRGRLGGRIAHSLVKYLAGVS
ncbi:MAG: hypothetical protein IT168_13080 [Bryobacterales bacterium]|nr:hypothetical protein [Bryobacterales bacterium]